MSAIERWADVDDDSEGSEHENTFEQVLENGDIRITEYVTLNKDTVQKTVRTVRRTTLTRLVNKNVEKRLLWETFLKQGDSIQSSIAEETMTSAKQVASIGDDSQLEEDWGHLLLPKSSGAYQPPVERPRRRLPLVNGRISKTSGQLTAQGAAGAVAGSIYQPPKNRGMSQRDDKDGYTVRVTNLSPETKKEDIKLLFISVVPRVSRVFLAKHKDDSEKSKGFAFVTLPSLQDCETAIKKLNGFGYDHLILSVEMAKHAAREGEEP
eukprot:GHVL01008385.1.p1 GENE.GHVL01008385.1~~GHVL01008385.1.p1  ORF type:complete len:266 (-),score=61.70 GHVL01008385.1:37-834(-)